MTKGIDISRYQNGLKMKDVKAANKSFVILRGGVTGYGAGRQKMKDSNFETFYQEAKAAGLAVGVYYYSCATSKQGGVDEANFLYENCLKGKQFEMPIYIDVENPQWQSKNKRGVTDAVIGFCETLESKGFYVGVYSSLSWFNSYLETARLDAYTKWVACWSAKKPSFKYSAFDAWQYSSKGRIGKYTVDLDECYKDFPSIIKAAGLNGFKKDKAPAKETTPAKPTKSITELAKECIRGDWGNGAVRKSRLTKAGYNYAAVQKKVNELLAKSK